LRDAELLPNLAEALPEDLSLRLANARHAGTFLLLLAYGELIVSYKFARS
jgi:hypothetical protein